MELTSETQEEVDDAEEIKNIKRVEAALFISARWLSLQELVTLTDINPILLRELLEKLQEKYNQDNSAIEILSQNDRWKMDVKSEYRGMINRLATGTAEFSRAEQETLAIIAYKQPVKQSIIIKIRGNKAYEHIKNFREIGLVRAKKTGHTYILTLSDEFYDYFNIGKKEKIDKEQIKEKIEQNLEKKNGENQEQIQNLIKEKTTENNKKNPENLTEEKQGNPPQ